MKRIVSLILVLLLFCSLACSTFALEIKNVNLDFDVKSAVLMDANTGTVLYSKNMNEALPPASVTKIMTLLLVFEAIERGEIRLDEILTVSENAASMGGSQVFLEPGEEMSVDELIKCVVVSSANDAALTLAERVGGGEEAFVDLMNQRSKQLGMENTSFENVTGLDDKVTNHVTSAYDIALMSRELLKHKKITEYTTIWMDTIRNGEFGLSNTNRLVKYYKGVTGLKTGFTSSAGFCISASAKRDNLHLIAVVMGAKTSNERNVCATKLLDFGFANYTVFLDKAREVGRIAIKDGVKEEMLVGCNDFELLENIGQDKRIITEYRYNDNISAPIKAGETVGKIIYRLDGKIIGESPIFAKETVEKMSFFHYFVEAVKKFVP